MESSHQLKMFTVQEANELIPRLKELIEKLKCKRDELSALEMEVDVLELLTDSGRGGVPSPQVESKLAEYEKAVNEFYSLIEAIHSTGCFLKDIENGLVDFYTVYKGRVVYLCWSMEEPEVTSWHDIGRGYQSRQPLEPEMDF